MQQVNFMIMKDKRENWIYNPTLPKAIFLSTFFLILILVSAINSINTFKKNQFEIKSIAFVVIVIYSVLRLFIIWRNYFRKKQKAVLGSQ